MSNPIAFGKYFLLERINVGGMAEVFKAKAFGVEGFERLVAVKRILPNIAEDEEFITMFIDEAKIAVQLQHANIAQIFDLGKVDDSYFIALEFVYGRDLRAIFDHLRKVGDRMPAAQVCYIVMQVCEGLDYAHNKRDAQGRELNLVHRDVSPQNVLIGYEGEIKLVDFGIAKAAGKASKTQAGILKGKFGYMSPEQVRGLPVDRRSDIFAIGICLYEMLTGERLFVGESDFSTLEKVRNVEILPPSSFNKRIAPELERIVLKALAKDVEDRYQNAIDLHDDLQAYLYSIGEFYSRKDLAGWMKKAFSQELEDENARNAQWERLEEPTPSPHSVSESRTPEPMRTRGGHGLEWDDEELETQIFDRPPELAAQPEERDSELSSSDILLTDPESMDDKTAIAPPPDEAQLALEPESLSASDLEVAAPSYGQQPSYGAGPPPGLSAFRQTGNMPAANPPGWGYGQHAPPSVDASEAAPRPLSPFRQTIMGIPQIAPSQYPPLPTPIAPPSRQQPRKETQARPRRLVPVAALVMMAVVAGVLYGGYSFLFRPGKLVVEFAPLDAIVQLDGALLKGPYPLSVDRPPGSYNLSVSREGYSKYEQTIQIDAGGAKHVKVDLPVSADTGFELTSDPPGQLVWLDGNPFTGSAQGGSQAKTDFKATRVPPGRHVLEIKGDPRFKAWRNEFYQEPGRILPIHATLDGEGAGGGGGSAPVSAHSTPPPRTAPPEPPTPAPVAAAPAARPSAPAATPNPTSVAGTTSTPPVSAPPAARPAETRPRASSRPVAAGTDDVPAIPTARPSSGSCLVTIGSKPWSEVWIDGRNTQKLTPLVDQKVPCGKRKITLKNPELQLEKSEVVTLRAGEKFKKIFQLLDEGE